MQAARQAGLRRVLSQSEGSLDGVETYRKTTTLRRTSSFRKGSPILPPKRVFFFQKDHELTPPAISRDFFRGVLLHLVLGLERTQPRENRGWWAIAFGTCGGGIGYRRFQGPGLAVEWMGWCWVWAQQIWLAFPPPCG